jgi:hypothetical protein
MEIQMKRERARRTMHRRMRGMKDYGSEMTGLWKIE